MSKTGVSSTPAKQDSNQFKKENRAPNSSATKDDKRHSDSFINPGGRNQAQHGSHQNRDRSDNQNDSHQYNKHSQDTKNADKEEKSSADQSSGAAGDKKFTGRCRLFVGNLTPDVSEDDFRKMFEPFGEISEVYVNTGRGFGFVRLDYRHNAEAAKAALDGLHKKGRILRVRFASHGAALKVKNLHPFVTNELLEQSFSQFGDLERCVVIVDDRGRPTSEGIVEFVRKPGANSALRRITEGVFLMGAEPKPIAVEPLEQKDEEDGMPEKFLTKTDQYKKEREKEPRFAPPGTFEYEFGMRWKQLEEVEKQRIEQIKKDTEEARLKLEDEMQNALYEYQAEQIRQDLRRQQDELLRLEELRNQDRLRRQQEHDLRRQQDDRERVQQDERRRADAMMMMRQQELARGRVPMDISGLRGRDDMMMSDRYGDRMPDRMGERMPDRMGERMPDRMGERMPDRMGERMPDRMGERMPDRMGERMPDRMGERMPDRMGERMPDRMGDRMPDRMGDRMPDRMGDRMPDRMGDRMPDRMGDRMPDRMGERMPDRMGERMPDRMGERMPDRMGDRMPDRMGPGQQGFMWEEKQRAEANLRGEAGRGRGSGAPPLQPPPVPPSAVNTADPGMTNPASVSAAPATTTTATAAQATKASPKPLMQAGFGGAGNPAGTGQAPNASAVPAAADANAMRRNRFEQGGPDNNFQNQRGVLGAPPGGIGGLGGVGGPGNVGGPQGGMGGRPGPLGPNAPAALVGNPLRGGPQGLGVAGAGPGPNLFQGPGNINERMLMERRREAAREELIDIKRMRRF